MATVVMMAGQVGRWVRGGSVPVQAWVVFVPMVGSKW